MIGRTFGRYRVDARLGAGGMGEAYRAHDATINRDVAVKVPNWVEKLRKRAPANR